MYATNVFARTQPDGVNIPMFAQSNPQVSALLRIRVFSDTSHFNPCSGGMVVEYVLRFWLKLHVFFIFVQ